MHNKGLSHTRWKCQYHIIFIPKYREKVLYGKLRSDVWRAINKPPLEVAVANLSSW